jgi:hypothetical protein
MEKTTNGTTATETPIPVNSPGPVQIRVEGARAPDSITAEEIAASTDQLSAVLSSPVVMKATEGLLQLLIVKASGEVEKAKAASLVSVEAEKLRSASAEQASRVNAEVARLFLRNLLALGLGALTLLGWMAWTRVVDGQVFSVLATVVITSVFGGTIYGTTLRPKDKS